MSAIDPKQAEQEELVAEWLRVTPGFFDKDGKINREKGLLFDSVEGSSDTSKEILVFFLISMYV